MTWTEEQAGKAADFVGLLLTEIQFPGTYEVVTGEDEVRAAMERRKAEGLDLAAISNIGVPAGSWRLTFLPIECYTGDPRDLDEPIDGYDLESGQAKMSIDEFLRR